jgi:hypothetical protein
MKTNVWLAASLFLFFLGVGMFLWGAWAFDYRLGVSSLGIAVVLVSLLIDDGSV